MLPTIEYETLRDFSGLDTIRQSCVSRSNGIQVDNLPIPGFEALGSLESQLPEGSLVKNDLPKSSPGVTAVMEACHKLSHEVFKNLSHALELPWEKYLGEMHEFTAPSMDSLKTFKSREPIRNEWSTLTIIVNTASLQSATVLYGTALSVFAEGATAVVNGETVDTNLLSQGQGVADGSWLVYYVSPNNDVFYTRTAGALMSPLSSDEYERRIRVRDLYPLA
ncbi:uncharacterized protein ASPGLDRAFT_138514 [Aspergillus glaucus CBS 516.65]|uniref:Uncharacterized protein n=1 Tax=Aspergillus glaucus CBS 516.65 TaxID=1160497 RepID=A0A1L9V3U7_ASPGL|nr:hypothetical protein ASPGLDRAFT_138514 [Aspergillus glaucus CBS 516.65]OJJ78613.1 hypothetical protein ASPGLDRAFT_138514 [Aspergillus glaucus CBS 516.65]